MYTPKVMAYVIFLFIGSASLAQNATNSGSTINHDHAAVQHVYGTEWVNNNPTIVAAIEQCLNERISYVQEPLTATDKYPVLSSFPLLNRYNSEIEAIDYASFSPDTFQPLTYSLPFFSDMKQVIRVDGTNYLIVIDPISRK